VAAVLAACFLFACTGNKSNETSKPTTTFESEIRVLKDITNALDTYKKQIKSYTAIKQVTRANIYLLGKLKRLAPQIEVIVKKHPEWATEPPAEVSVYVGTYLTVNEEFTTETLKLASDIVDYNSDDKELSDSYDDLVAFLTPTSAQD
jgi:hypothetical protein